MDLEKLKQVLNRFEKGEVIISVHEKYKDSIYDFLKINNIKTYYVDKYRCYLNFRTSTYPRYELRNSEVRKIKKLNKQEKLEILNRKKQQLEKEIEILSR